MSAARAALEFERERTLQVFYADGGASRPREHAMTALRDRVVVITGASAGIGRAAAEQLADAGAAVVVSARRADRLDELSAAIAARGGRALAAPGDVTSPADMRALVSRARDAFGRLDVVIANAGIGLHGPLDDARPEDMRRVVDVNLLGTFYTAQAALAVFRPQGHGHLIVVSSFAGKRGLGGSAVYGATKAGAINMVESLRAEFAGTEIRASVVLPVSVDTEFRLAVERDFGLVVEGRGPKQPVEEVARAIVACVARPRAEVYTHRTSRLVAVLNAIAPARTDRFMQQFTRRATKAPPSPDGPAGA
jgi:NADP-dependent 3-hydroxy acid dehydrogenase YdfG